jgi:hypothetical protein
MIGWNVDRLSVDLFTDIGKCVETNACLSGRKLHHQVNCRLKDTIIYHNYPFRQITPFDKTERRDKRRG